MKRAFASTILLLATACGGGTPRGGVAVPFRVRTPLTMQGADADNHPLTGADKLLTWVEHTDGQRIDRSQRAVHYPATSLSLPSLPLGADLVLRVDAYSGSVLLARGRSYPFSVGSRGASHPLDLFLGSLGRFGRRVPETTRAAVVAVLASTEGTLIATSDGVVTRFDPFAATTLAATEFSASTSTLFAPVGSRLLAAFDPTTKALSLLAPDGSVVAALTAPELAQHGDGAMLVANTAGDTLLLVGGQAVRAGEIATAVTRVAIPATPSASSFTAITPGLSSPRWLGDIVWVPGSTETDARALVLGGQSSGAVTDAFLIDPSASGSVATIAASAIDVTDATIVSTGASEVLVVGGPLANDVRRLVVAPTATPMPSLAIASPSPQPLSTGRRSPSLVPFASGLVLVVGGADNAGVVTPCEIVDVRTFPGLTVQTGPLPLAATAPFGALLPDQSVWVFSPSGIFGYVPPRGQ